MFERRALAFVILTLAVASGCPEANLQEGPGTGGNDGGGIAYADGLLSLFLVDGGLTSCQTMLPDCYDGTPQPGTCGASPALGPPNGSSVRLQAGDSLEVGFLCGQFITSNRKADAGDLAIWGSRDGGTAVVEVSQDGANFYDLGVLGPDAGIFTMNTVGLSQAQFVLISGRTGTVSVDSVEAL